MTRGDLVTGGIFLVCSTALLAAAASLPEAAGGLPGPGFFPTWIAAVAAALSVAILVQAVRGRGEAQPLGALGPVASTVGLTFVYLLLWGTGLFAVRTAVFLLLFLRMAGQSWRTSALVGVALSAAITLVFQIGLRVSLE